MTDPLRGRNALPPLSELASLCGIPSHPRDFVAVFASIHHLCQRKNTREGVFSLEQMTGIEPAYSAWEADVLPLNYICTYPRYYYSTAGEDCQCETVDTVRLSDPPGSGILYPLLR